MLGITVVSNSRQMGHWRSMYSTIVTGAFGLPRTLPCWGMPLKRLFAVPESGSVLAVVPVALEPEDEPPVSANASATATAASAITPAPIASTFGDACLPLPPVLRTGGGAGVLRSRRAFLPLVMSAPR